MKTVAPAPALDRDDATEETLGAHAIDPRQRIALREQIAAVAGHEPVDGETAALPLVADDVADLDVAGVGGNDGDDVAVVNGRPHAAAPGAEAHAAGAPESQADEVGAGPGPRAHCPEENLSSKSSAATGSRSSSRKILAHHVPDSVLSKICVPATGTVSTTGSGWLGSWRTNVW